MEKISKWIIMCGIICLTIIEIFAMTQGINGVLMTTIIGIIALAIGITIPGNKILKESEDG